MTFRTCAIMSVNFGTLALAAIISYVPCTVENMNLLAGSVFVWAILFGAGFYHLLVTE